MHIFFTKAMWLLDIKYCSSGPRRFAKFLVTILAKLCVKLMGLYSKYSLRTSLFSNENNVRLIKMVQSLLVHG
jgi:hypothetical protein